MVLYCLILVSASFSLVFPQYMCFYTKLITWYVMFSLTVTDSPNFLIRCAADVFFGNRLKIHVFDIPQKFLTASQPMRELN